MPKFDYANFFKTYGVEYIDSGKNVKAGNLNIGCPWCGENDQSHHLGTDPETGYFGCWRNRLHRGQSPKRLIMALLRCGEDEADSIIGDQPVARTPFEEMRKRMAKLTGTAEPETLPEKPVLYFPDDFRSITSQGLGHRFIDYLINDRHFRPEDTDELISQYDLGYSLIGRWAHRLIMPFYVNGQLEGWTGRAVGRAENRYLSYPSSEAVKRVLFNYDATLNGSRVLTIVEGAVSCLKTDFYGQKADIRTVGTLGTAVTDKQISLLLDAARRFDTTLILFDPGAYGPARTLASCLASVRPKIGRLPSCYTGPDDLKPADVIPFLQSQLSA